MPVEATAVCFPKADTAELVDVVYEDPTADQMIVRVNASGISAGTEGSIFRGTRTHNGTFPLITGYQGAGVVEWAGEDVAAYSVGDRVSLAGVSGTIIEPELEVVWGTHASRVIADEARVLPIPDAVTDDEASLSTVWAVGMQGPTVCGLTGDDTVLVVGLGLIGLSFAQVAADIGADVIGLDLSEERVGMLREFGMTAFTDREDVSGWLGERGMNGFPVAVEATGSAAVVDIPLEFVAPGGRLVWQGWYPGRVSFDYNTAHGKMVVMHFPCGSGNFQGALLDMIGEGRFNASALISDRFPVEQCQEAYNLSVLNAGQSLGVVLEWPQ